MVPNRRLVSLTVTATLLLGATVTLIFSVPQTAADCHPGPPGCLQSCQTSNIDTPNLCAKRQRVLVSELGGLQFRAELYGGHVATGNFTGQDVTFYYHQSGWVEFSVTDVARQHTGPEGKLFRIQMENYPVNGMTWHSKSAYEGNYASGSTKNQPIAKQSFTMNSVPVTEVRYTITVWPGPTPDGTPEVVQMGFVTNVVPDPNIRAPLALAPGVVALAGAVWWKRQRNGS